MNQARGEQLTGEMGAADDRHGAPAAAPNRPRDCVPDTVGDEREEQPLVALRRHRWRRMGDDEDRDQQLVGVGIGIRVPGHVESPPAHQHSAGSSCIAVM